MTAYPTCPNCGSSALFHSRRQRADGFLRLWIFSAIRCHLCGHRHFRVNVFAVAAMVAVVLAAATFVGVGEIATAHHAGLQTRPIALAQVAVGNHR